MALVSVQPETSFNRYCHAPRNRPTGWLCALLLTACSLVPASALALGGTGSGLFSSTSSSEFLPVDEALPFSFSSDGDRLILTWNVTPGHYLYQDRITVTALDEGVTLATPEFSLPGENKDDPYFGPVTVFHQAVTATVPVILPANTVEANLQVSYQGCADAGLCYPPQTRDVLFYPGTAASQAGNLSPTGTDGPEDTIDTESATGLASFLASSSTATIAAIFLLLGLGLTFTPCVLPMVPIISALVSSRNTQTHAHALLLSSSYVIGMALTYAAAGVITGLLGASFNLQAQLQSPWVLGTFAAMFVAFSLSMFNVYDLQLPRFLRDRLNHASHQLTGSRVASIFAIGALSSLVVSPCVSAPLAGSLLYISTTQDAALGGIALFSLGIGMGIPLILVAVGGRRLLPATGPWMNVVKSFYGVMLLAVAVWLVERLIPSWATLTLWGLLATVTGVQLGAFDKARAGWERTWKGLGLVLFAYGIALLAGALSGAHDPLKPLSAFIPQTAAVQAMEAPRTEHDDFLRLNSPAELERALQRAADSRTPVMLDFYADWCISCKVMERQVFDTTEVKSALSNHQWLQFDVTDNTPEQQALLNRLGLFGPPAILFYQANGREAENLRVLGEMDQEQFLNHIAKLERR
ncbi:protein-disulfide reductase DsbD [Marinobacter mobilis]|uniref:Thiol:disulfide interchange protein DsbD n=1 Tax=Marinobacter mobilis TaxID=488533 RepID=A0A1H2UJV9_9GAMM|nr:protein-disulfide reductase DsbD [Marinobacter mobilis]SDW56453.1 thiol:disulfide interchange protein DsbD [Marinobacter mobilis]